MSSHFSDQFFLQVERSMKKTLGKLVVELLYENFFESPIVFWHEAEVLPAYTKL
jgi:hypothetical protein